MAPLPTILNVVRCDIQWNVVGGVSPHNSFHIGTTEDDMSVVGLALGAAFDDGGVSCWGAMHEDYTATQILLTPLDGHTAGTEQPLGTVIGGASAGTPLPSTAAVLSFRTTQRGSRGRGRIYQGPVGENGTNSGLLEAGIPPAVIVAWQTAQESIQTNLPDGDLVVASYTHSDAESVVSIGMRFEVGTQRRRQDQLVH
jgi:hypothetical protein